MTAIDEYSVPAAKKGRFTGDPSYNENLKISPGTRKRKSARVDALRDMPS